MTEYRKPSQQELMETISNHYRETRSEPKLVATLEEWPINGQPLQVYAKPPTLYELNEIQRRRDEEGMHAMLAQTVITRAMNQDGSKIFATGMFDTLMRESLADIVGFICIRINRAFPSKYTGNLGEAGDEGNE